jgi:hypothetical protein
VKATFEKVSIREVENPLLKELFYLAKAAADENY